MPRSSSPEINNNFISTTTNDIFYVPSCANIIDNFYVPRDANIIAVTAINKDITNDINTCFESLGNYFDKKSKENIYMDFWKS